MSDANVRASDPRNAQVPGSVSVFFLPKGETDDDQWLDLGSIIDPKFAPNIETLDHFSTRRGQRAKDRTVVTQRTATLDFSIDEINLDNLKVAFGSKSDAEEGEVEILDNLVAANPGNGLTIQLPRVNLVADSIIIRSTLREDISEQEYSDGPDYTVDESTGIITIGAGDLADPGTVAEIHIQFKKLVTSQAFEIFEGKSIEGKLRLQILTEGGAQYVVQCDNVTLENAGDITLGDGTTWQQIALRAELLAGSDGKIATMHLIKEGELEA